MYDRLAGSVPQALWVVGDYVLPPGARVKGEVCVARCMH